MEAEANPARVVVGSVASMASVFTVGYVTWLIRGGHLLVGVLGSIPIWRFVDPLPILSELAVDDDDDESLANMVDEANERDETPGDGQSNDIDSTPSDSTAALSVEDGGTSPTEVTSSPIMPTTALTDLLPGTEVTP